MSVTSTARLLAAGLALLLGLSAGIGAVQSPTPATPDVQKLGPQVGERVPDFTLADQHGVSRTLKSLMGRSGLMLVFFRSADW